MREFTAYKTWKAACKRLGITNFTGDRDIDSCSSDTYYCEWDGAYGTIEKKPKTEHILQSMGLDESLESIY